LVILFLFSFCFYFLYFFAKINFLRSTRGQHTLYYICILPIACLYATYIPLIAYLLYTTIYYLCPTYLRLISCINPPSPQPPHHRGRGQPRTLPRYLILMINMYCTCMCVVPTYSIYLQPTMLFALHIFTTYTLPSYYLYNTITDR
jgi:hypothetical protein